MTWFSMIYALPKEKLRAQLARSGGQTKDYFKEVSKAWREFQAAQKNAARSREETDMPSALGDNVAFPEKGNQIALTPNKDSIAGAAATTPAFLVEASPLKRSAPEPSSTTKATPPKRKGLSMSTKRRPMDKVSADIGTPPEEAAPEDSISNQTNHIGTSMAMQATPATESTLEAGMPVANEELLDIDFDEI